MYEHDYQAHQEASRYAASAERLEELRVLVDAKRGALGAGGVRGHSVAYEPANWQGLIPTPLLQRSVISRGDVFDLAGTGDLVAAFAASFLWGTGRRGYGPHRYREIVESTDGRLPRMLASAAATASRDVINGYAMLYGGYDPKDRAAPNGEPWTRIDGFRPAFFTKFLYFTTPGALILDNVLARKVNSLSGMPYLVKPNGNSYDWSPYRYAVYLHGMRQTAEQLQCSPDELEVTLFSPPPLPGGQA